MRRARGIAVPTLATDAAGGLTFAGEVNVTQGTSVKGRQSGWLDWARTSDRIAFLRTGFGKDSKHSGVFTMTASGDSLSSLAAKEGTRPSWRR